MSCGPCVVRMTQCNPIGFGIACENCVKDSTLRAFCTHRGATATIERIVEELRPLGTLGRLGKSSLRILSYLVR